MSWTKYHLSVLVLVLRNECLQTQKPEDPRKRLLAEIWPHFWLLGESARVVWAGLAVARVPPSWLNSSGLLPEMRPQFPEACLTGEGDSAFWIPGPPTSESVPSSEQALGHVSRFGFGGYDHFEHTGSNLGTALARFQSGAGRASEAALWFPTGLK